jgi:Putative DNA-binding domain
VASLRELQLSFAAALTDPGAPCAVTPAARLDIYRGNVRHNFHGALEMTFPVLRRRVGDEYFAQLARLYHDEFPSRSGDLHHAGSDFARFLAGHLAGGDYAWLADLARLEWARQSAAVEAVVAPVGVAALAAFEPAELEHLRFTLQPSMRLIESPYPVFSVWLANQTENAAPVDQSMGSECGMTLARSDGVEVARLAPDLFSFLSALAAGSPLGEVMTRAGLDGPRLSQALGHAFGEQLVTGIQSSNRQVARTP